MANQYQSIDPTLVAINAAKKVTPQAKKPVPASLTTQAPIQPSLNFQTQQPQAISTNITPPVAKIGGISSPFGAPNINSTPVLGGATPQEIGTRATELQSLPKQIPASGTTPKQTTVYGELFDDIKLNNLTEQEMAQYYPEIPESIRGSLFDDIKLNGLDEGELPSLYPELQGGQQTPLQGGVKGGASREGFNLGAREWINPVGKVFEEIDKQLQRIPNVSQEQVKGFLNDKLGGFGADFSMLPTMAVNTPGSLLKTAGAIGRGVTNPLDTITGLYNLVTSKEGRQALGDRYGSIEGLQKTISEDPVGVASDILTIVQGGAGLAGKGAKLAGLPKAATKLGQISDIAGGASNLGMDFIPQGLNNLASKPGVVGKVATVLNAPVSPLQTAGKIYNNIPQAKPGEVSFADKAVGVYNGLDPETVRVMRDSPDIIKQLDEGIITKESMKNDLVAAVEQIKQQKKDVGGIYQKVYSNPTTRRAADIITKIENGLREQGVKIENGKIVGFDTTKMAGLTDQSKSALRSKFEDVMGTLRDKDIINVEDYHNIRKDIYGTSYQDGFITKKAPGVSKLSDILNEDLKQIPGFKEIDSGFKEASDLLDEIKSNVLNKEGDFKGTLKALLGEKGQNRLAVLDKHFPGFKEKLKGLAAYDDYLNTRTRKKVGLYEKAGAAGAGAIAGFMTFGPVGAVIGGLATTILKDFITDPKRFKDYIVSKAGKNLASKIELGTPLNIAEKTQFEDIINEVQKQPDLILPYKPTEVSPQGKVQQTPTPPKPTPKTPPITVEKGAIGMGTPKVNNTPVIPPKATVTPSVSAPKTTTLSEVEKGLNNIVGNKIYNKNTIDDFIKKAQDIPGFGKEYLVAKKIKTKDDFIKFINKQVKQNNIPDAIDTISDAVIDMSPEARKKGLEGLYKQIEKSGVPVAPKKGMPKLGKETLEQDITTPYKNNYIAQYGASSNDINIDARKGILSDKVLGLSNQLKELPNFEGKTIRTSNSIFGKAIDKVNVGDILTDKGFLSSSKTKSKVRGGYGDYEIVIDGISGKDITKIKGKVYDKLEPEILFDRNTPFIVKKKIGNKVYIEEQANKKSLPPLPKKGMPKLGKEIMEQDYGMQHRPSKSAPSYNLAFEKLVPDDIYTNPEYYADMTDKAYKESFNVIKKIKGNPDADVVLYRATPKNELNNGDWVSLSKEYAKREAMTEGVKVHEFKVKAKDIYRPGDDINEFGYFGDNIKKTLPPLPKKGK